MEERKVELSVDEYKSLLVSDHMLYHIVKIVESELEWDWDEAKLDSRGKSIINYLALEDKKIAERIEELKEYEEKMDDTSRIQERLDEVNEELYLLERIEELDEERRSLLSLLNHE